MSIRLLKIAPNAIGYKRFQTLKNFVGEKLKNRELPKLIREKSRLIRDTFREAGIYPFPEM